MANRSIAARGALALALLAWTAFWFWAFSFAYSDGFFVYNRHTRIPTFVAALTAAVLMPVSAVFWASRSTGTGVRRVLGHVACCVVALALLPCATAVLSRADPPWHLEADDAMGAGIDFLLLVGIAIASLAALLVTLALRSRRGIPRR